VTYRYPWFRKKRALMSVKVMTWVLEHSTSTLAARLVLIAIADNAGDDGAEAYPSVATIARKARVGERTVQESIPKLVKLGELEVSYNAGPRGANRYRVIMTPPRRICTPAGSAPPGNEDPSSQARDPDWCESSTPAGSAPPQDSAEPPAGSAPEPSLNRPSTDTTPSYLPSERTTPKHRKSRRAPGIVRDPAEQALFDTAAIIAARWWEYRKRQGPVVSSNRFPGFRDSIVLASLRGGATEQQVKDALVACGETFPSVSRFERALRGEPANGHRNGHYEPPQVNFEKKEYGGGWTPSRSA
jgi:helix-turn-helix protein